ncbi:MAG: hypothetical protein QM778_06115 [Myxococcales bacterium]
MKFGRRVVWWALASVVGCGDSASSGSLDPDGSMGSQADAGMQHGEHDSGTQHPDADGGLDGLDGGGTGDAGPGSDGGPGDAGSDGGHQDAGPDANDGPPVSDPSHTGFVAYGQLKLAFDRAVDAAALEVSLSPARPQDLAVLSVAQAGPTAVLVSLNQVHLPIDYVAKVSGPDFELDVSLNGLGNGSRVLFASQHTGNGDLRTWIPAAANAASGPAAGDIICQAEADAAGLEGTFRAFISSGTNGAKFDAACRALGLNARWADHCGLASAPVDEAPILDLGGLPVVNGASGIAKAQWLSTVHYKADGTPHAGNTIWTGGDANGQAGGSDCLGFTSSASSGQYSWATASLSDYLPDDYYSFGCSTTRGLLCVQSGSGFFPKSTLHERTGKALFLTSTPFPYPSSGSLLDKADAFCQDAAQDAGYANHANFVAWLSDTGHEAPCRLVSTGGVRGTDKCGLGNWPSTGPWVRADGFVVANNIADLISGSIRVPLLLDAAGNYLSSQSDNWVLTKTNLVWGCHELLHRGTSGERARLDLLRESCHLHELHLAPVVHGALSQRCSGERPG